MTAEAEALWLPDRFTPVRQLGWGEHARVWLAEDNAGSPPTNVAIKVPRQLPNAEYSPAALVHEARMTFLVPKHASLVQFVDSNAGSWSFDAAYDPYLAVTLAPGTTLYDHMNRGAVVPGMRARADPETGASPEALTVSETVRIGQGFVGGLAALHRAGVVHGDVSPRNIMVGGDRVKLVDFGQSTPVRSASTPAWFQQEAPLPGNAAYQAPESLRFLDPHFQAYGAEGDPVRDVYAAGLVLHEMLTGRPTVAGRDTQERLAAAFHARRPARVSETVRGVPRELDDLVADMTARDPNDRPRSAEEVLDRLREVPLARSRVGRGRSRTRLSNPQGLRDVLKILSRARPAVDSSGPTQSTPGTGQGRSGDQHGPGYAAKPELLAGLGAPRVFRPSRDDSPPSTAESKPVGAGENTGDRSRHPGRPGTVRHLGLARDTPGLSRDP